MTRYYVTWEVDNSNWPTTPKERIGVLVNLMKMAKEETTHGKLKEWGNFSFTRKGYFVLDGAEQDVYAFILKYSPHFKFSEPTPVLTVDQSMEFVEKLAKMIPA